MLFPAKKLQTAGSEIQQILQKADKNPKKLSKINDLLEKHFGSSSKPNPNLMPNVPASEVTGITKIIRNELMTQGQSEGLGGASFKDLQSYKNGAEIRGKFDRSISSGKQQLYRNFARAYGNVIKEALPEIKKPYKDYGDAANALKNHGGGIQGLLHTAMYGGGLTGWAIRNATIYPAVRGIVHALAGGQNNQLNPNQPYSAVPRGQLG